MNARCAQVLHQRRVLVAARPVADTLGIEQAQSFPHALWPARFAGVRGAMQSVFPRKAISAGVGRERESCFVAGNIERRHAAARKCSTSATVARLCSSEKCRSVQRMTAASIPVEQLKRSTSPSMMATTRSGASPRSVCRSGAKRNSA